MSNLKGDTYTFTAQPKAVQSRKKYRDPAEGQMNRTVNIMADPRIVRGSTYSANIITTVAQADPVAEQQERERRKAKARRIAQKKAAEKRPRTPEAVQGRKHIDIQTELYLEEIIDRVPEAEVETQTDPFLDRPATPEFIPVKSGADVSTQILEGDLFHFDVEVRPIVEVIIGKTLEQALMEVLHEEELAALRERQREFEQLRVLELAEVQRLEEQERRKFEEKERRVKQEQERLEQEEVMEKKVEARGFSQQYLASLMNTVFTNLHSAGFFYDTVEKEIDSDFLPWLLEKVDTRLDKLRVARRLVDDIIRASVRKMLAAREARQAEIEERIRQEEERKRLEEEEKLRLEEERRQAEEEERLRLEAEQAEKERGEDEEEEEGEGSESENESESESESEEDTADEKKEEENIGPSAAPFPFDSEILIDDEVEAFLDTVTHEAHQTRSGGSGVVGAVKPSRKRQR
eukprot:GCRY01002690.1.p1 GENE.GCRY01002690.1~~GCRY01002690.1.p1  ORF type:complete len:463 (-),score=177.97 GCRY01002690.1:800-2188(-)